ncbi:MAG: MFS transporter, partial [Thermoflexibacteraceae bacterium]
YQQLLIARSITGLFGGVLFGLVMSIVSDVIPPERRGMGMGILMTSFSVASTLGVPLGIFLATKFFLQLPFFAIAGFAVLVTLLIYGYIPPINTHIKATDETTPFFHHIKLIFLNPNQLLALVFSFLINFGQFIYIPFLSDYFVSNVGFSTDQLPLIYLVGGICTFFTAPLVGKMVDRVGRVQVLWVFGGLFLLPLYFCTTIGHTSMFVALLLIAFFFITNNGRVIASSTIVSMASPPANRGSFMSFSATINSVGIGIGSYLGGVIITKTPEGVVQNYNIVGYMAIAVGLLIMWLGSRIRNAESAATHTEIGHE